MFNNKTTLTVNKFTSYPIEVEVKSIVKVSSNLDFEFIWPVSVTLSPNKEKLWLKSVEADMSGGLEILMTSSTFKELKQTNFKSVKQNCLKAFCVING